MIKTYSYHNITWIDAESPTEEDISLLVKERGLHPLIGEELLSPTWNGKADMYENYFFLSLQMPLRTTSKNKKGEKHSNVREEEIDFVIGKDFIITSHEGTLEPLHSFAKSLETNAILDKKAKGGTKIEHPGLIFYYLMKKIYAHVAGDLDNIRDALGEAEKHIFLGHERKMVEVLSELSRDLIDFRQILRLHGEILASLKNIPATFFLSDHFAELVSDVDSEYQKVHNLVINCRELVGDLRETNDSLLTTKQNESMRLVSILAFVTLPLSLLADIFSMNTSHAPIIGLPYDFEIILGIMIVATVAMFYYFKRKGWL